MSIFILLRKNQGLIHSSYYLQDRLVILVSHLWLFKIYHSGIYLMINSGFLPIPVLLQQKHGEK